MLVPPESLSSVLVIISKSLGLSATVLTLKELKAVKQRFLGRVPLFDALVRGNVLTQRHEIWSQQTTDSTQSYGKNLGSLSHLGFNRYRVVTDSRQTDRITIDLASKRLTLRAVARNKNVKMSVSFHLNISGRVIFLE